MCHEADLTHTDSEKTVDLSYPVAGDILTEIVNYRKSHHDNFILSHININSFRHKFPIIQELLTQGLCDFLTVSETKLDESFTSSVFDVTKYVLYRQDRNSHGGGLLVYIHNGIPHRRRPDLEINIEGFESLIVELHVKAEKWCIVSLYKPPSTKDQLFKKHFEEIATGVLLKYDVAIFIGDLNFNMLQKNVLHGLCDIFGLDNVIHGPTCFKSSSATALDVILTNAKSRFYQSLNTDFAESDFHNFISVSTRSHAARKTKKVVVYRSYKHFNTNLYRGDIQNLSEYLQYLIELGHEFESIYSTFQTFLEAIIEHHAPTKRKTVKNNYVPYMNSDLRKAIFKKRVLHNKSKSLPKSSEEHQLYRKACNYVTSLKRKSQKQYFKDRCDGGPKNQNFWKTIKPYMKETNGKNANEIMLLEGGKIIMDPYQVATILSVFYANAGNIFNHTECDLLPITGVLHNYKTHPSIKNIQKNLENELPVFNFHTLNTNDVRCLVRKLNVKKAAGYDNISAKLLKIAIDQLAPLLTHLINLSITKCIFPNELKLAEIIPVFKKNDKMNKENYRPISLLPVISKIFERAMEHQLAKYFNGIFNVNVSGFRKKHSCQHVLLSMTEEWRKALDKNKSVGAIAMDLSKAFDCLPHGLLISKLHAYNVSHNACTLIAHYLTNRMQRVRLSNRHSEWSPNERGVPQGSILGPLLFNIFTNDLFFIPKQCSLHNYADDNTISYCSSDTDQLLRILGNETLSALSWFQSNYMKANPEKFQFLCLGRLFPAENKEISIANTNLSATQSIKILGVTIDSQLKYDEHVSSLCKKAGRQLNVLMRLSSKLCLSSRMAIYKSFILSTFNYCPTVWMFCGISNAQKLDKIQERALQFVFKDRTSSYEILLEKACAHSLEMSRIYFALLEVYRCYYGIAPQYMQDLFTHKVNPHKLRDPYKLYQPKFNTVKYGFCSFAYFGARVWNMLPPDIKKLETIDIFKNGIKQWCLHNENAVRSIMKFPN